MDVSLTSYSAALDYLFARVSGGWKLGLDTTRALLAPLGDPHERFPTIHVAGTNGKGSVVSTIDALLRAQGWRVGRYTSPHLIDFRERICVNGEPIAFKTLAFAAAVVVVVMIGQRMRVSRG